MKSLGMVLLCCGSKYIERMHEAKAKTVAVATDGLHLAFSDVFWYEKGKDQAILS